MLETFAHLSHLLICFYVNIDSNLHIIFNMHIHILYQCEAIDTYICISLMNIHVSLLHVIYI